MSLVTMNWNPTPRQLRQFAALGLVAAPLAGWLWGLSWTAIGILAGLGAAVAMVGVTVPRAIKPLFVGLSLLALPVGLVVGEVALLGIYFLVFVPIGLCFRAMRRDALQTRFDQKEPSYWRPKAAPKSVASYYRQS